MIHCQRWQQPWRLAIGMLCLCLIALATGRYPVNWAQIIQDIQNYVCKNDVQFSDDWLILGLRLPRILMALLAGAALSGSGMVYQCLFRNPLVSPDILGISSGACLGAAIGMILLPHPINVQWLAFSFGIFAVILTQLLASLNKGNSVLMLVMSGIVISSFCNALLSLLKYLADPYQQLPGIVFWIMGSLHQVGWQEFLFSLPYTLIGLFVLFILRGRLNAISLGTEEAQNLGINVPRYRQLLIIFSTLAVGSTIAITGIIGWIGLVVPHISRMITGADHRYALPHCMMLGGSLVLIIDTIARSLTTQEIPIGIVTALIGAPIFAYLLIIRPTGWGKS